jgi:acetoin utilization deacetylase AcuC-like enzyme
VGENAGFADACFAQDAVGFRCVRGIQATKRDELEKDEATEDADGRQASPEDAPEKTGFLYRDLFLRHDTGVGHPERPQRLEAIVGRLESGGLLERLERLGPGPPAEEWLTAVHDEEYLKRARESCESGLGYVDTPDAPASRESFRVAVAAVSGVLGAVDAVATGRVRNVFCAVRPPGHHALRNRAMGFCILNNVALAARYAQRRHKLAKVLIVDWDVHHGNGTQTIFYDDPSVLYFGVHRSPFYPGTGGADERGEGKGLGFTINVPLAAGSGDEDFVRAFEEKLRPAALTFRPDLVLISAGFDAHERDPLGGMKMTTEGYARLTSLVKEIAERTAAGRVVSVLEGGYDLEGLAAAVEAHLRVLMA